MQEVDPEIKASKKKLQIELILKDSDVKKNVRSGIEIETALRDLKHKESLIQMEILSKEKQLKKIEAERSFMENELIRLKHKINSLGH